MNKALAKAQSPQRHYFFTEEARRRRAKRNSYLVLKTNMFSALPRLCGLYIYFFMEMQLKRFCGLTINFLCGLGALARLRFTMIFSAVNKKPPVSRGFIIILAR